MEKLRGSLVTNEGKAKAEKTKLRGSLAPRQEIMPTSPLGVTLTREELPDIESLPSLIGKTIVQRDGGEHYRVDTVSWVGGNPASGRKYVAVESIGGVKKKVNVAGELFLNAITTEGGAWRVLK